MSDRNAIKCPTCDSFNVQKINSEQFLCKACGTKVQANQDDAFKKKIQTSINLRQHARFKEAIQHSKELLEQMKSSLQSEELTQVYLELFYAENGIIFETENNNQTNLIPVLYNIQYDRELSTTYYEKIMSIDPKNKAIYQKLFNDINHYKQQYLSYNNKIKPYDIFLCYNSDTGSKEAQFIYDGIRQKVPHLNIFYAPVSIQVGSYGPHLHYAIDTSKLFVFVATDANSISKSKWVYHEIERFKKRMMLKHDLAILPIYKEELEMTVPYELRNTTQAINILKPDKWIDAIKYIFNDSQSSPSVIQSKNIDNSIKRKDQNTPTIDVKKTNEQKIDIKPTTDKKLKTPYWVNAENKANQGDVNALLEVGLYYFDSKIPNREKAKTYLTKAYNHPELNTKHKYKIVSRLVFHYQNSKDQNQFYKWVDELQLLAKFGVFDSSTNDSIINNYERIKNKSVLMIKINNEYKLFLDKKVSLDKKASEKVEPTEKVIKHKIVKQSQKKTSINESIRTTSRILEIAESYYKAGDFKKAKRWAGSVFKIKRVDESDIYKAKLIIERLYKEQEIMDVSTNQSIKNTILDYLTVPLVFGAFFITLGGNNILTLIASLALFSTYFIRIYFVFKRVAIKGGTNGFRVLAYLFMLLLLLSLLISEYYSTWYIFVYLLLAIMLIISFVVGIIIAIEENS